MFVNDRSLERGQTIPFYVFAIIISFAMSLFVMNYTNTVRWHIRAQNAADAVALASIAGEAALENQRALALYSLLLNDNRAHSIPISMANAADGIGFNATESTATNFTGTCNSSEGVDDSGYDCDNAYDQQPAYYDTAVSQYATALGTLESLTKSPPVPAVVPPAAGGGQTPPPLPDAPAGSTAQAAFSVAQSGTSCNDASPQGAFDCSFFYNADLSQTGPGTKEIANVIACRTVSAESPQIFGANIFQSKFDAVGQAAATLVPVVETGFSPGTKVDPNATVAGSVYAPTEKCPPSNAPAGHTGPCTVAAGWMDAAAYDWNPSPLLFDITFYVPAPTTPPAANAPAKVCKQG